MMIKLCQSKEAAGNIFMPFIQQRGIVMHRFQSKYSDLLALKYTEIVQVKDLKVLR